MYVNIAVVRETRPHERRVALVPSVTARLTKLVGRRRHLLQRMSAESAHQRVSGAAIQQPTAEASDCITALGARLHRQSGTADAIRLGDAAFKDVVFVEDRIALVRHADMVLAVRPPEIAIVDAMKPGAILIPGRASPKLIDRAQVAGMKAGAVIVDLSAEAGGNYEDTQPGKTVQIGAVTIVAPLNVPSLLGEDASALYAKNVSNLLGLMLHEKSMSLNAAKAKATPASRTPCSTKTTAPWSTATPRPC